MAKVEKQGMWDSETRLAILSDSLISTAISPDTPKLCEQQLLCEDEKPPPSKEKMKDLPTQPPTYKELNPQSLKRDRNSCKVDPVRTFLEIPPVEKETTASPAPGPISPFVDPPPTSRCLKWSKKDLRSRRSHGEAHLSLLNALVPNPSHHLLNETIVPQAYTDSPMGTGQQPVKPSPPPETTVDTKQEDPESFFHSLVKKTRLAPFKASTGATTPTIDPPPTAEEIVQAKNTLRCLMRLSFRDILCKSEPFAETLNTLVRSQALGLDLHETLQLFKHAFGSLSQTYESTRQSKFKVDNRLRQVDILAAELNQGILSYQKLKKDEEDAKAKKKAVEDQISMFRLELSQLDDKLTNLSSEKEGLYQTMKDKRIAYEKLEGELPSLSFTTSKLEAELADTEKAWLNFRNRFGSL